jgi:hypothetical protein
MIDPAVFTAETFGTLLVGVIIAVVLAALVIAAISLGLFRAGKLPHPAPLVISLSLLAIVALVGGLITGSGDAYTIAATGIGALAGALSVASKGTIRDKDSDTPSE